MQENKKLIYSIFIAVIVVCGILYVLLVSADEQEQAVIAQAEVKDTSPGTTESNIKPTIYVQICGAVKKEGVYQVSEGTRVFEILEMAGGLTEDADADVVNQAREAIDGERILFPTIQEVENGTFVTEEVPTLVHINTANKEQLMTLPGVGEAKALSIIAFRETNNGFKTIEEIMQVDGIKESMFNKIKDLITL